MPLTHPNSYLNASLVNRGIAYVVDCGVTFVGVVLLQLLLLTPVRNYFGFDKDWFKDGVNVEFYTLLTISIPVWLYFALFESSRWQATPGKRLLTIRVIDMGNESRISFAKAILRTFIKLVPWELAHLGNNLPSPMWYTDDPGFRVCFLLSGLAMFVFVTYPLFNSRRQCLHDIFASTWVTAASGGVDSASKPSRKSSV